MRFGFGMRRAAWFWMAVSAFAMGGCGSLSGGLHSESLRAATAGAEADQPLADALAPEQAPTGAVFEQRAGEQILAPTVAFRPASFELIPAGAQPSYMVASVAPLAVAQAPGSVVASQRSEIPVVPVDDILEEYDPWEPFNEKIFSFNYNVDKFVLKPVAKGYNFVVPDRLQQMIENGFDNLLVVQRVVNNLLQWRPLGAGAELGRFLINSTLGIGGLFDIARQEFGLQKTKVDFGQTLGIWGLGPGPYLILPFLPPLTVRDGIGTAVDGAMDPLSYVLPFIWARFGMKLGSIVNDRALNLDLYQGFEETTVDLYSAVRNGFLQRRDSLIKSPPVY